MRGTNAFALKMKENYKNHLKGIESVKEDEISVVPISNEENTLLTANEESVIPTSDIELENEAPETMNFETLKQNVSGEAPEFSMKPKDKDVLEGTSVRFTCNTKGSPDPILDWYFEGSPVLETDRHHVKNTYGLSTLMIKDVVQDDIGEYKVIQGSK